VKHFATLLVPPFLAVLYAHILLYIAALRSGLSHDFFNAHLWVRWDSGHYLRIAQVGYSHVYWCKQTPSIPVFSWCGDAAWMPLYPWLISLVSRIGVTPEQSAVVISAVFAYLLMVAVWYLIGPSWDLRSLCCLALAAAFPGMVYFNAVFPMSLVACVSTFFLILLIKKRYFSAGLAGVVAIWSYSASLVLVPISFVAILLYDRGSRFWEWVKRTSATTGTMLVGVVALLAGFKLWTGDWFATAKIQSNYGSGIQNPVFMFIQSLSGGTRAEFDLQHRNPGYLFHAPKEQSVFVLLLLVSICIVEIREKPIQRSSMIIVIYSLAVWLLLLLQGPELSRYRSEALLIPCVALVRKLPLVFQLGAVAVASFIAVDLAQLFYTSLII
jgi:hypothetical protein